MTRATSIQEITHAAISGIEVAFKKYHSWSEDWLDYAPESFVAVHIGAQCATLPNIWVTMEGKISETLKEAGAIKTGRPYRQVPDLISSFGGQKAVPEQLLKLSTPCIPAMIEACLLT